MSYRDLDGYDPAGTPAPEAAEVRAAQRPRRRRPGGGPLLAGGLAFVAAVGALRVLSAVGAGDEPAPPAVTSTAAPSAGAVEPTTTSPAEPTEPTAASTSADAAGASRTARRFVAAWARPDLTDAQWHAGVAQYASDSFAQSLRSVDPSRVPATRVRAVRVQELNLTAGRVRVITDGPAVVVLVQREHDVWVVSGLEPESDRIETEDD